MSPYDDLKRAYTWQTLSNQRYDIGSLFVVEQINHDPVWAGSYNRGDILRLLRVKNSFHETRITAKFENLITNNIAECYDLEGELRAGYLSIFGAENEKKKEKLPKLTLKDMLQEEDDNNGDV